MAAIIVPRSPLAGGRQLAEAVSLPFSPRWSDLHSVLSTHCCTNELSSANPSIAGQIIPPITRIATSLVAAVTAAGPFLYRLFTAIITSSRLPSSRFSAPPTRLARSLSPLCQSSIIIDSVLFGRRSVHCLPKFVRSPPKSVLIVAPLLSLVAAVKFLLC